ncbi:hypothetical protein LIER_26110 [Lithospermum erythrorhizon]|uniref:Reverse transcriptase n=1 Tax=Lithospermum erythrorhizon TaxID=34254 RepID=A0AAV3R7H2_LITER
MCGYQKIYGKPRCAIKVDIMKAYDTQNWDFLWLILEVFGYPITFISWIKACVTNGNLNGFFKSGRGLRQGTTDSEEIRLSGMLGIPISTLPIIYLGIPLTTRQMSSHDCRTLVEKVKRRIDGWGSKKLSFAGRLTLINSVIFGLLTLRESLKGHVKYNVESGTSVKCLHDNWSVVRVMADVLSYRDVSNLCMLPTNFVAEFMHKVKWLVAGGLLLKYKFVEATCLKG